MELIDGLLGTRQGYIINGEILDEIEKWANDSSISFVWTNEPHMTIVMFPMKGHEVVFKARYADKILDTVEVNIVADEEGDDDSEYSDE